MSGMEADESHVPMISVGRDAESSKIPQYLVTMAVSMIVVSSGTTAGWSSPALAEMRSPNATMPLTPEEGSWVSSLLPIGAFLGAMPAGAMADIFGRKWTIMCVSIPITISWVMMHLATSVGVLYAARFLAGLGFGAVCATVPIYLVEIAEDSIRGTLGATFQLTTVIGVCYSFVIGAIFPYTDLPLFCGIFNVLFIVLFYKAPESPIFLLQKGRRKQAEDALTYLRGSRYNIYKEVQTMETEIERKCAEKVPFTQEICKRSSLLSLATCLALMLFQQLSGINVVIFYMESIFHDAGSSLDPAICTIIAGVTQIVATMSSTVLIDHTGRKILLQVSSIVMSLCLAFLGYYFHLKSSGADLAVFGSMPVLLVLTFLFVYGIGYGPIPWLMSGEMLPPEIKGPGLGMAAAFKWFLAFAVVKSFQPLSSAVGAAVTYWIFASVCVIGFFFSTFVVIETRGKSLVEIQEELFGKKGKKKSKTNDVV